MKKSYSLLITILLTSIFSYLAVFTLQTKSFSNKNLQNQYLYIQAKNHLIFTKEYINTLTLDEINSINHIQIDDELFNIEVFIKKINEKFQIEFIIQSKELDIRLYEKVFR